MKSSGCPSSLLLSVKLSNLILSRAYIQNNGIQNRHLLLAIGLIFSFIRVMEQLHDHHQTYIQYDKQNGKVPIQQKLKLAVDLKI